MCACLTLPQVYKEKHPKSEPHQQGRRKSGRPSFRYTGGDADFTDSSDDDTTAPLSSLKAAALALKAVKEEEIVVEDDTAAVAKEAAAVAAREGGGGEDTTSDAGSEGSSAEAGTRGSGRGLGKGKRAGGDTSRKGKRARVVDVAEGGRRWLTFVPVSIVFNPPPLFSEEGAVKIDGTVGAVAASPIVAQEYKGWIGGVLFVLFVDLCFGVWGKCKVSSSAWSFPDSCRCFPRRCSRFARS